MTYKELDHFCQSLKATSYVNQWGGAHVWKVSGKVFAVGGWEKEGKPAITFKTSELNYHFLADKAGYRPAPYLASRGMKWIQQFDDSKSENDEIFYYLQESYRLVSLGLTKKKQRELGLNQDR